MFRLLFLCSALFCAAATGGSANAAGRVALVIANSQYQATRVLNTPPADAQLVVQALNQANFETVLVVSDATKAVLEKKLSEFARLADSAEVALLYYAGHGVEAGGQNYIIPIDAKLTNEREADLMAIRLDTVRAFMANARLRVIVLDACRENPFPRMQRAVTTRAMRQGLLEVEPADGEAVFYSTRDGTLASDGTGKFSPFARAFATRLIEPGTEISLMFRKVRDDVKREVPDQEPFAYSSLSGDPFFFVRTGSGDNRSELASAGASSGQRTGDTGTEALVWQGVLRANTPAAYRDYLNRYPHGAFAAQAREIVSPPIQTAQLRPQVAATVRPSSPSVPVVRSMSMGSPSTLGLTVRPLADGAGLLVDQVARQGPAASQIFPGDLIVGINSAPLRTDMTPEDQLNGPFSADGRIKLLIRRGQSSTLVVLRQ